MSKKKKKKSGGKSTMVWALVLILIVSNAATVYYFMFMQTPIDTVPAEDVPMGMYDVLGNPEYIGETVTLLGYYIIAAGNQLLVSNPMFYFNNSLETTNYVVLAGSVPSAINESIGKQIAVKGTLELPAIQDGGSVFYVDSFFDVYTELTVDGSYVDVRLEPYMEFEQIPYMFDVTPEKYAVLYSGGINTEKDHYRYWNDIIYMHFILLMHGYDSDNIYVIYKDGVSEDGYTGVDYPATHDSLDTVFGILSEEMGRADTLFFYTTNHGGSGGISVWNPMDSSGALTHSQVANWVDSITYYKHMIIVMEQCVSGKFIQHLSDPKRVIMTACKDDESSYACDDEGNWDEFVYHFMCALVGFPWNTDGSNVDADFLPADGYISMREAFVWAAAMDSRSETPWYNDNGDGVGYNVMQVAFGSGPWFGGTIGLEGTIP